MLKNTPGNYGAVSKVFHWLSALLVIALLCIGLYMTNAEKSAQLIRIYDLHKSTGITVLALTALRVLWHFGSKRPPLAAMPQWERLAAKASHFFLYFALFAMPLSGWLMSSAHGRAVKVFGMGPLPDLVGEDHAKAEFFEDVHEYLAWLLIAAILLHAAAALEHHFIDKDATLKRMLPFCRTKE